MVGLEGEGLLIAGDMVLILAQANETVNGAYQVLVDAAIILYFLPFLYMYAAAIKLACRPDRQYSPGAVLVPGGRPGVWIAASLGFVVCLLAMALSMIPPAETASTVTFELKLLGGTTCAILIALVLYSRSRGSKTASDTC